MSYKFAAALMGMDLLNVQKQIEILNNKVEFYHVDVMDWHYVKNMCSSPQFIEQISTITKRPIDVHVMVEDLDLDFIKVLIDSNANFISLHPDTIERQAFKYIEYIKSRGCKLGVVLNPATPIDSIKHYIHLIDKINFMAVNPGFAKQNLIVEVLDKIKEANRLKQEKGYHYLTEIDGACNEKTFKRIHETGVDVIIVGGTALFSQDKDLSIAWNKLLTTFERCIKED
jgi:D-allulose-6-phosphate 3-epimerase